MDLSKTAGASGKILQVLQGLAVLTCFNLVKLARTRYEFVVVPTLSSILSLSIVPYGLMKFSHSASLGMIVAIGLLVSSIFVPSTMVAVYTVIELSLSSIELYLALPVPRSIVVIARLLAASALSFIPLSVSLAISTAYGVKLSVALVLSVVISSIALSLGASGLTLLFASMTRSVEGISLVASVVSIFLMDFSPIYFPLSVMPTPLRIAMMLNPATPVVTLVRRIALGGYSILTLALEAIAISTVWFTIGLALVLKRVERM